MAEAYGLAPGTSINYRALGFPAWVDQLCSKWGLDSSTYAGHQEGDRPDIGAAPNPDHLNRGIDWAGDPQKMLDFAHWLVSIAPERVPGQYGPSGVEMVIYRHAPTGEDVWYPRWVDFSSDLPNHCDHVHTRFSASVIDVAPLSNADKYALAVINVGRELGISPRGIQIAFAVVAVESGWQMFANSNVPDSMNYEHDAVGSDHDSTGLFQQRQAWGPLSETMNAAGSARLFFLGGHDGQRGLTAFDYNDESNTPGFYAQSVQVSGFPDRYDEHWDEAVALYDRLAGAVTPPTEEGPSMALSDQEWRELLDRVRQLSGLYELHPSKSRYADDGQLNVADQVRNGFGFLFDLITEHNAALGDAWSLNAVQQTAARGDQIAANFLRQLNAAPPAPPTQPPIPPADIPPPSPPNPPPPQSTPGGPQSSGSITAAIAQFKAAIDRLIG